MQTKEKNSKKGKTRFFNPRICQQLIKIFLNSFIVSVWTMHPPKVKVMVNYRAIAVANFVKRDKKIVLVVWNDYEIVNFR